MKSVKINDFSAATLENGEDDLCAMMSNLDQQIQAITATSLSVKLPEQLRYLILF
ncbi:MAG: hypothetical protein ACFC03_01800 [Candidatus Malihini olakiniferum]